MTDYLQATTAELEPIVPHQCLFQQVEERGVSPNGFHESVSCRYQTDSYPLPTRAGSFLVLGPGTGRRSSSVCQAW